MSSQSTLENDDLFGEAAAEMRADVETHLRQAWAELPDSDEIWNTEADNVLGVLNGLRSGLDAGDAEEHLRQAKKWYTMGERADAFEDADDLVEEIQAVEEVIEMLEDAREQVGGLTSTMPQLRGALDEAAEAREDATDDAADESEEDAEAADDEAADEESEADAADESEEEDEE
ncbi:hypothetical protein SAMN04487948_12147 [Halogranum amylolyticum]|uniref:Uncharacterized protein n=1 Tax=Halogranum amylolyticum TaxID=660520 RepID=A0A1H8VZ29_9EURY|nr:DUF5790 family protein [Halogranum amylolyticum]SEP20682.1 hypothetical protein SAMN04487948_12147 [Halogranum amylolyticum]